MKRAHTVKFNDPFGLARANERKVGSRTLFNEESETYTKEKRILSKEEKKERREINICKYEEETRLWVNV